MISSRSAAPLEVRRPSDGVAVGSSSVLLDNFTASEKAFSVDMRGASLSLDAETAAVRKISARRRGAPWLNKLQGIRPAANALRGRGKTPSRAPFASCAWCVMVAVAAVSACQTPRYSYRVVDAAAIPCKERCAGEQRRYWSCLASCDGVETAENGCTGPATEIQCIPRRPERRLLRNAAVAVALYGIVAMLFVWLLDTSPLSAH